MTHWHRWDIVISLIKKYSFYRGKPAGRYRPAGTSDSAPLFSLTTSISEREHSAPCLKGTEDYFSADLAPAIPVGESIIGTVFPAMTSTEQSTPVIGSIDQVALPADGTKSFTLILLEQFQENANEKALALLQKISPVAWQHIHFLGHYTFRDDTNLIDLEAMLANVTLE